MDSLKVVLVVTCVGLLMAAAGRIGTTCIGNGARGDRIPLTPGAAAAPWQRGWRRSRWG
jgi:hypothetical protein